MPTSYKVKAHFMRILPPLKPPGNIYELGSGWGTLALALAKRYPHHTIIGYELSPIPYFTSVLRAKFFRLNNIKFKRADYLHDSWGNAHLVVCYLYPKAMEKLNNEFQVKLHPGTWVISHTFAIPGWTPYHTYEVPDLYHTKIYTYKVP
jgi:trans-aconitate methyltransferase